MRSDTGVSLGVCDAWLLAATGDAYSVAVLGATSFERGGEGGLMTSATFRPGWRWPDDIPERDRPLVGRILAMVSFLNSPFIDTPVGHPEMGKHDVRQGKGLTPEGVRFVRLRPSARSSEGGEARSVEWTVRWIVRGHHRAQWYPSTKSHRLIWVAPYMKGPDDAPLKTPAYAVVR